MLITRAYCIYNYLCYHLLTLLYKLQSPKGRLDLYEQIELTSFCPIFPNRDGRPAAAAGRLPNSLQLIEEIRYSRIKL